MVRQTTFWILLSFFHELANQFPEVNEIAAVKIRILRFHKDNFRHLPRFPDFFVTFRILSWTGLQDGFLFLYPSAS